MHSNLIGKRYVATKLTEADIYHIRYLRDNKLVTVEELAKHYKIGQQTVTNIAKRVSFFWLTEKDTNPFHRENPQ